MEASHAPVLGLLVVGIVMAGCGSAEPDAAADGTRTIRSESLSVELPPGWYGDAERPEPQWAPMLRAATFALTEEATDQGQQAQSTMADGDILITVVDYGPLPDSGELAASTPVAVDRSHAASSEGFREPVVNRSFTLGGHHLQLWVVFGSSKPTEEHYREANRVLATLAVRPRTLALGGLSVELLEGWHGFAKDIGPPHQQVPALYVANVPWPDRGQNLSDSATLEAFERLPPNGIVVAASAGPSGGEEFRRELRWPVRLSDGHFRADSYEGQPAPHLSTQTISGRLGGRALIVQVYFGRNDPTDDMRAEANRVLSTLQVKAPSERN
jgi:hypothetical protein